MVMAVVVIAVILERLIALYFKRLSKRLEWQPNVAVGLVWVFRLLILLGAVYTLTRVVGAELAAEWVVTLSALGGAAVGFASSRTLGNFISGLFVLVTRPFHVNDYVRIDNIEGIVEEITFNYTKVRTRNNTLVYISNLKILDQNIVNYRYQDGESHLYCYTLELAFDHSLSIDQLEKTIDEVIERYAEKLPKKPEYAELRQGAFERSYAFYIYVKDPKDIFTVHPEFAKDITRAWDKARGKG